jgi:hypothetical protein
MPQIDVVIFASAVFQLVIYTVFFWGYFSFLLRTLYFLRDALIVFWYKRFGPRTDLGRFFYVVRRVGTVENSVVQAFNVFIDKSCSRYFF